MRTHVISNTLEGAWLRALREVSASGEQITDTEPFLEIRNLEVTFLNAFETSSPNYEKIFGTDFLEYMRRVYSSEGDPKSGRNYFKLMRDVDGIDQVRRVIKKLHDEPLTRSATIVLAHPNAEKQPCVSEVNFSMRGGLLDLNIIFKSSDLAKKFIPDIIEIAKVHEEVSRSLHTARGRITAFVLSAQLYESDLLVVRNEIARLKEAHYFKTDSIRANWDKEAETWDVSLKDPLHYVNIENGYARFLDFLQEKIPYGGKTMKVALDSGCGTGAIAAVLDRKGYEVVAIDISPKMLEFADKESSSRRYVLANSLDIPYEDGHFNLIASRGVLISHVGKSYLKTFLTEHARVLKPGGLFVFDFITHFNADERRYHKTKAALRFEQLAKLLSDCGFELLERSGTDNHRVNAVLTRKK